MDIPIFPWDAVAGPERLGLTAGANITRRVDFETVLALTI